MRDWTSLFIEGQPLYDQAEESQRKTANEQLLEEEKDQLLNEGDFNEYRVSKPKLNLCLKYRNNNWLFE